jgi:hypothetical protein
MTTENELDFDRAARRISHSILWIGGVGTVAVFAAAGWKWGGGFVVGATVAWFNFHWLKRLVEGLGGGRRPGGVWLAGRYFLLGIGAYVIVRFSPISAPAIIVGTLVLIAAIFAEVLFELLYARK